MLLLGTASATCFRPPQPLAQPLQAATVTEAFLYYKLFFCGRPDRTAFAPLQRRGPTSRPNPFVLRVTTVELLVGSWKSLIWNPRERFHCCAEKCMRTFPISMSIPSSLARMTHLSRRRAAAALCLYLWLLQRRVRAGHVLLWCLIYCVNSLQVEGAVCRACATIYRAQAESTITTKCLQHNIDSCCVAQRCWRFADAVLPSVCVLLAGAVDTCQIVVHKPVRVSQCVTGAVGSLTRVHTDMCSSVLYHDSTNLWI